jgi:hypothetical protein
MECIWKNMLTCSKVQHAANFGNAFFPNLTIRQSLSIFLHLSNNVLLSYVGGKGTGITFKVYFVPHIKNCPKYQRK